MPYNADMGVNGSDSMSTEVEMATDGLLYVSMKVLCENGIAFDGASSTFKSKGVHVVIGSAKECKAWRHKSRAVSDGLVSSRAISYKR